MYIKIFKYILVSLLSLFLAAVVLVAVLWVAFIYSEDKYVYTGEIKEINPKGVIARFILPRSVFRWSIFIKSDDLISYGNDLNSVDNISLSIRNDGRKEMIIESFDVDNDMLNVIKIKPKETKIVYKGNLETLIEGSSTKSPNPVILKKGQGRVMKGRTLVAIKESSWSTKVKGAFIIASDKEIELGTSIEFYFHLPVDTL